MTKEKTTVPAIDPALKLELAKLKATNAPVVYFDFVGSSGIYLGMANMTVECGLHLFDDQGNAANDRQVVAHLRFPLASLRMLKDTIARLELASQPVPDGAKN